MAFTKHFTKLSKEDVGIAGGKGASLGEMTQAGIPVPPGFVVLSDAFEHFIKKSELNEEIDSELDKVKPDEVQTVEKASKTIQELILKAEMPPEIATEVKTGFNDLGYEFVAVRSSATAEDSASAAWAGQLDSYLNTTKETLLENLKRCWASLFTPRAIFYRFEKNLNKEKVSVAVVIQAMVESYISGIAFSVHPVTKDHNQLIIEAGYGLGESIVQGQITPDSYVVDKKDEFLIDINVATQEKKFSKTPKGNKFVDVAPELKEKQKLTGKEIIELAKIIMTIEKHYGFPVDVEFAYKDNKFFIVQSRPITTLGDSSAPSNSENSQSSDSQDSQSSNQKTEDKFILGNHDIDTSFLTIEMTWKGIECPQVKEQLGINMPESFVEFIKGRTLNYYLPKVEFKKFSDAAFQKVLSEPGFVKYLLDETRKAADNIIALANKHIRNYKLPDKELAELMMKITHAQQKVANYGTIIAFCDTFGQLSDKTMEVLKKRKNLKYPTYVYSNVLENPGASMAEEARKEIANSKITDELVEKYYWLDQGYIGRGLTRENAIEIKNFYKEEEHLSREELKAELNLTKDEEWVFELSKKVVEIKSLRADARQYLHVVTNKIVDYLAEKWNVETRFIEVMCAEEIVGVLNEKSLPKKLQERWEHSIITNALGEYDFLYGEEANKFLKDNLAVETNEEQSEIKGNTAQPGTVRGPVKLVFGPQHNNKVNEGDILVSIATSPQLLPAMKRAAAFITDIGGVTSHAAIVSRELKKPCIVGTRTATQILKDDVIVEVDGDAGVVKIIK